VDRLEIPAFDHYRPAEFLIVSPNFIAERVAALFSDALNRFEAFFKKLNALI
jgi:hypothetical protein